MTHRKTFAERWKVRASELRAEIFALYLCYQDARVPWFTRAFTALVVAYAFRPIDLIPDFIPVLGYLDDLLLIPAGVALAIRLIPPAVLNDCRKKAVTLLDQEQPQNWWIAVIIIAIWVAVCAWIMYSIFNWLIR